MTQSTHRLWRATVIVSALILLLPSQSVAAPEVSRTISAEDCHVGANSFLIPKDSLGGRVPPGYQVTTATGSDATLFVQVFACTDVAAGGTSGPVVFAEVSVQISPNCELPGCLPDLARIDEYLLFLVTNSKPHAQWLRSGTGLDVTYVRDIEYRYNRDAAIADYFFHAPAPSPSPFTVSGVAARPERTQSVDLNSNWWQDTKTPDGKQWTVRFQADSVPHYFAPGALSVTAEKGSELDEMISASEPLSFPHITEFTQVITVTRR